ncbi:MAG: hypothetical protein LBV16_09565 [Elusimicrobiota bacterium]|nr:hypothetical protein [Elusimicrobiota bacterium]
MELSIAAFKEAFQNWIDVVNERCGSKRSFKNLIKVDIMEDKNFKFFYDRMPELYKKYGHKFLVVKDCAILADYDDFDTALKETLKKEKLGTFLIQECFETQEQSIQYFQSNVSFANFGA